MLEKTGIIWSISKNIFSLFRGKFISLSVIIREPKTNWNVLTNLKSESEYPQLATTIKKFTAVQKTLLKYLFFIIIFLCGNIHTFKYFDSFYFKYLYVIQEQENLIIINIYVNIYFFWFFSNYIIFCIIIALIFQCERKSCALLYYISNNIL